MWRVLQVGTVYWPYPQNSSHVWSSSEMEKQVLKGGEQHFHVLLKFLLLKRQKQGPLGGAVG